MKTWLITLPVLTALISAVAPATLNAAARSESDDVAHFFAFVGAPVIQKLGNNNSLPSLGKPNANFTQVGSFNLSSENPGIRIVIRPDKDSIEVGPLDDDFYQSSASHCGCARDSRFRSCLAIYKASNGTAPSGEYQLWVPRLHKRITVYCEMGLNGGGYTFINPIDLPCLIDSDVQSIFTNKSSFLLRTRQTDGTQPYGVLQQLSNNIPLQLYLSNNTGYTQPVNVATIGGPYMFYGFIPAAGPVINTVQGFQVNGNSVTYVNCDGNPNSYIALFPNFAEKDPTDYAFNTYFAMNSQVVQSLKRVPSGRVMPESYFMFLEMHQGGCGTFTQTDGRVGLTGVLSASIGFR